MDAMDGWFQSSFILWIDVDLFTSSSLFFFFHFLFSSSYSYSYSDFCSSSSFSSSFPSSSSFFSSSPLFPPLQVHSLIAHSGDFIFAMFLHWLLSHANKFPFWTSAISHQYLTSFRHSLLPLPLISVSFIIRAATICWSYSCYLSGKCVKRNWVSILLIAIHVGFVCNPLVFVPQRGVDLLLPSDVQDPSVFKICLCLSRCLDIMLTYILRLYWYF